jgi:hypothetical protein
MATVKRKVRTRAFRATDVDQDTPVEELGLKNDCSVGATDSAEDDIALREDEKRLVVTFVTSSMKWFLLSLVCLLVSWAAIQHGQAVQLRDSPLPRKTSTASRIHSLQMHNLSEALAEKDAASPKEWLVDSFPFHRARTCLIPFEHPLQQQWQAQYDRFFGLVGQMDAAVEVFTLDVAATPVPPESASQRIIALYRMVAQENDLAEPFSAFDKAAPADWFQPVSFTAAEVTSLVLSGPHQEIQRGAAARLEDTYRHTTVSAQVHGSARLVANLDSAVSLLGLNEFSVDQLFEEFGLEPDSDTCSDSDSGSDDAATVAAVSRRLRAFDVSAIVGTNELLTHEVLPSTGKDNDVATSYRSHTLSLSGSGQHPPRHLVALAPAADIARAIEQYSAWLQAGLGAVLRSPQYRDMIHRWSTALEAVHLGEITYFDQQQHENAMNVTNQVAALTCDAYARLMHISPFRHPTNKATAVLVAGSVLHEALGLPLLPLLVDPTNTLLRGALGDLQYASLYQACHTAVHASIDDVLSIYIEFSFGHDGSSDVGGGGDTDALEIGRGGVGAVVDGDGSAYEDLGEPHEDWPPHDNEIDWDEEDYVDQEEEEEEQEGVDWDGDLEGAADEMDYEYQ